MKGRNRYSVRQRLGELKVENGKWKVESYFLGAPNALGIAAASFVSGVGNWDSGTGIWEFGDIFERGEMKRAKIERKARRVAERPKESHRDAKTLRLQVKITPCLRPAQAPVYCSQLTAHCSYLYFSELNFTKSEQRKTFLSLISFFCSVI